MQPFSASVFSTENPYRTSLKRHFINGKKVREIKNYFKEGLMTNRIITVNKKVITIKRYRKTYETIMKHILKNNFEILDYIDARPLPKAKKLFPEAYKKIMDLPYFCVWKLRKR